MKQDIIYHRFLMGALHVRMDVKILKRVSNAIVKIMILYKMNGGSLIQMNSINGMMIKIRV